MANTKPWSMNDTQTKFVQVLGNYPDGATLLDLKIAGFDFKTGSINVLKSKNIVAIDGEKSYEMDIVFNGTTVGKVTKTYKVYKLVK